MAVPRPWTAQPGQRFICGRIDHLLDLSVIPDEASHLAAYEFCDKEFIMADQAKRMGEDALEQAGRMGGEFQKAAERGFEAASQSFSEANRGFQAFAAEMTDYSKRSFDDAIRTWEQLIGVRSLEKALDIQAQYAKRVYDNHMTELSKLAEMYTGMIRDASKPIRDASTESR